MIRPDGSLRISGEAFAIERLRENPELDYASLQHAANEAGVTIQPIQFGRARRQLGLTGTTGGDAASAKPTQQVRPTQQLNSEPTEQATAIDVAPEMTEPASPAAAAPTPAAAVPAAPDAASAKPAAATPPTSQSTTSQSATSQPATSQSATPTSTTPTPTTGKSSPAFEFLMQALRDDPTVSYGELKATADRDGFKIAPIMYGRAKALLGLVPVRPRGSGKRNKATRDEPSAPRSQAGAASTTRQQTTGAKAGATGDGMHRIEDLVQLVQRLEDERRRLRGLLVQIANTIDEALDQEA